MLTKKEQSRYRAVVNQLSRMSRNGWEHATHPDYEPLEAELKKLGDKMACKTETQLEEEMETSYYVNRQIGDYVVTSKKENVAPFFVRMAGAELPLSTHWSVTDAVQQLLRYQAADRRRT